MLSHDVEVSGVVIDGVQPSRLGRMRSEDLILSIYRDEMGEGHVWLAAPKPLQDAAR